MQIFFALNVDFNSRMLDWRKRRRKGPGMRKQEEGKREKHGREKAKGLTFILLMHSWNRAAHWLRLVLFSRVLEVVKVHNGLSLGTCAPNLKSIYLQPFLELVAFNPCSTQTDRQTDAQSDEHNLHSLGGNNELM